MKKEYMKVVFFSLIALLITTGCQKKAAEPVDVADSSAVVDTAQKEAEERAAAERKAEEERMAAEAAAAQRAEEERMAAEAETQRRAEEERMAAEAAAKASDFHTVIKGESLWKISESSNVYADPFQWPVIYKANRDQIKDPDLIYPDQKFELPRNSSQEDIDAAVHEAKTRGPWSLWDGK